MASKVRFLMETLENIDKAVADIAKIRVCVGIMGDKGLRKENKGEDLTNAEVGALQEFGSLKQGIPRRSFLEDPLEDHKKNISDELMPWLIKYSMRGRSVEVMMKLGVLCVGKVAEAFSTSGWGKWAPNADMTVILKGSDKPLIDTGQLAKSISYMVVKK